MPPILVNSLSQELSMNRLADSIEEMPTPLPKRKMKVESNPHSIQNYPVMIFSLFLVIPECSIVDCLNRSEFGGAKVVCRIC
jgi:hypothetical protein